MIIGVNLRKLKPFESNRITIFITNQFNLTFIRESIYSTNGFTIIREFSRGYFRIFEDNFSFE